ncbi:MAG: TolC family protein [Planctomycetota bacterium]
MRLLHPVRFSYRSCALPMFLSLVALVGGCGAKDYARRADKEVYGIIAEKQRRVFGEERPFSIGEPLPESRPADSTGDAPPAFVPPASPLSLEDAMSIAFLNNRDYQTRKESLYSRALTLTSRRHDFAAIWGSSLDLSAERDTANDTSGAVDFGLGFSRLLANGARFSLGLSSALSQFFTGSPARAASSVISASIVQPLLRNAGRLVATESLTQAERDVLYELRSFARFQQTFAVSVASEYLRVLERERFVENERLNYENLVESTARIKAFADEGLVPQFQYDQSHQSELSAQNRYVTAKENYESALDNFKITLGISTSVAISLDSNFLTALTEEGLIHPDVSLPASIDTALRKRYDYLTARNRLEDRRRKLAVAAKQLGPEASLSLTADVGTTDNTALHFDLDKEGTYGADLALDLPLDRNNERNAYRQAIIDLEQAGRSLSLADDQVKLEVRDDYRRLGRARETYLIQQQSVKLAESRVESTTILLEDGRAETRDLLEAQSALVNARNDLASAVVEHTIARLQFYRDIGTLDVDERAPIEAIRRTENPPEEPPASGPPPEPSN